MRRNQKRRSPAPPQAITTQAHSSSLGRRGRPMRALKRDDGPLDVSSYRSMSEDRSPTVLQDQMDGRMRQRLAGVCDWLNEPLTSHSPFSEKKKPKCPACWGRLTHMCAEEVVSPLMIGSGPPHSTDKNGSHIDLQGQSWVYQRLTRRRSSGPCHSSLFRPTSDSWLP